MFAGNKNEHKSQRNSGQIQIYISVYISNIYLT